MRMSRGLVAPPGDWRMQHQQQQVRQEPADAGRAARRDGEMYQDIVHCVFEHNVDEMERILRVSARVRPLHLFVSFCVSAV